MKNNILILLLANLLFACSNKSELDSVVLKNPDLEAFVEGLKNTSLTYSKCADCKLSGLEGKKLTGFTDRYPPEGKYDKKEIDIETFEYDSYLISNPENADRTNGILYICYFNQKQKEKFKAFSNYYSNRIEHYKQFCQVSYINNTVIITIKNHI